MIEKTRSEQRTENSNCGQQHANKTITAYNWWQMFSNSHLAAERNHRIFLFSSGSCLFFFHLFASHIISHFLYFFCVSVTCQVYQFFHYVIICKGKTPLCRYFCQTCVNHCRLKSRGYRFLDGQIWQQGFDRKVKSAAVDYFLKISGKTGK